MSPVRQLAMYSLAVALAGCGTEPAAIPREVSSDPATKLALEVPLLVDPGLDTQSRRFAVMSDPAPLDGSVPLDDFAPATAVAARAEASRIAGPVDTAALTEAQCPSCSAPTLGLRTASLCKATLLSDLAQVMAMPAELPVYPRAHLREAGAGKGDCSVRAASFTAPANATEALDFYRALAPKSGFALQAAHSATMSALIGSRDSDGARLVVIARPLAGRTSEIDLIVSGL